MRFKPTPFGMGNLVMQRTASSSYIRLSESINVIQKRALAALNPTEHLFSDDLFLRTIAKNLMDHPERTPTSTDLRYEVSVLRENIRMTTLFAIDKTSLFDQLDIVLLDIEKLENYEFRKS